MKITIHYGFGLTRAEKKGISRAVRRAKSEKDITAYTRPRGIWMMASSYHKTLIFWK